MGRHYEPQQTFTEQQEKAINEGAILYSPLCYAWQLCTLSSNFNLRWSARVIR